MPGSEAELHDADEDAGAFASWDVVNYGAPIPALASSVPESSLILAYLCQHVDL